MFTFLSKIGFRDDIFSMYGFNPPLPSYTLREKKLNGEYSNSSHSNLRKESLFTD
jgi:hypothetical protein